MADSSSERASFIKSEPLENLRVTRITIDNSVPFLLRPVDVRM